MRHSSLERWFLWLGLPTPTFGRKPLTGLGKWLLLAICSLPGLSLFGQTPNGITQPGTPLSTQPSLTGACSINNGGDACLTGAPFYGTPFGATSTTLTSSLPSGATTASVASCSTFQPKNGFMIPGAGASGANFIGSVVSCYAGNLVFSPATSTSVASGTTMFHDETAAILSAYAYLQTLGGGTILLNDLGSAPGVYLANGLPTDPSGGNAILQVPTLPNYTNPMISIKIAGFQRPNWDTPNGSILRTFNNTAGVNLIGGYDSAQGGGYPSFTNVKLVLENLTIQVPSNPNIEAVDAHYLQALDMRRVLIRTDNATIPTAGAYGTAVEFPSILNEVENFDDDTQVAGFFIGYRFTEHTRIGSAYASANTNAFQFDSGTNATAPGTYNGNSINASYLWGASNTTTIAAGNNPTVVNIGTLDTELAAAYDINDPNGYLHGVVGYLNPYNSSQCTLKTSGAANLVTIPLYCAASTLVTAQPISSGSNTKYGYLGPAMTAGTVAATQGFLGSNLSYNGTAWKSGPANASATALRMNSVTTMLGSALYPGGLQFVACGPPNPNVSISTIDTTCTGATLTYGLDSTGSKSVQRLWLNPGSATAIPGNATSIPSGYSANIGTDAALTINTPTTLDHRAAAVIASQEATDKPLVVQGAPGQTADMQQWQNSAGTNVGSLTAYGKFVTNGFVQLPNTIAFSTTPVIPVGTNQLNTITLTGNVTSSTIAPAQPGEHLIMRVCEDSTGNRSWVWPTSTTGGMTISTAAGLCSMQEFVTFNGTTWGAVTEGVSGIQP